MTYISACQFEDREWILLNAISPTKHEDQRRRFDPKPLNEAERHELLRFYKEAPIVAIQRLNSILRYVLAQRRGEIDDFIDTAINLEIFLDNAIWIPSDDVVYKGIPPYFMDGYADMGNKPSSPKRTRFKVDKEGLREDMVTAKRAMLLFQDDPLLALEQIAEYVHREMPYNSAGVKQVEAGADATVMLSEYREGGVCRQRHNKGQVMVQTAGFHSQTEKGVPPMGDPEFDRHVWAIVTLNEGRQFLQDFSSSITNGGGPSIDPLERVLELYGSEPRELNHYKISFKDGKKVIHEMAFFDGL